MRNHNGYGSVIKLSGNRRKPYACRKTLGFSEETGYPIYKYISYHKTRKEAEKALREYNDAPYEMDKKTVKEVYDLWIEKQHYSYKVKNKYENAFKRIEPLQHLYMNSLTLSKLQLFFDNLEATEACLRDVRVLLNFLIDYSIKRGLLPITFASIMPLIEAEAKKPTRKIERSRFSQEEIDNLWKRTDDGLCRLILFYIYTGLRYSEVKNAEWHEDYVSITKAKTPAGIRDVPLSDKALSLLPLPEYEYKDYLSELKAAFPEHTPHDTRHTFTSLMTEAEVDPRLLKKILGHKPKDITEEVYTHISMEKLREAVNKI